MKGRTEARMKEQDTMRKRCRWPGISGYSEDGETSEFKLYVKEQLIVTADQVNMEEKNQEFLGFSLSNYMDALPSTEMKETKGGRALRREGEFGTYSWDAC